MKYSGHDHKAVVNWNVSGRRQGRNFEIKGLHILSALREHVYCVQVWHFPLHKSPNSLTHSLSVALETLVGFWPHQPASSILFCCSLN